MVLSDSHCHITEEEFFQDRQEVLSRAQEAGISQVISVGGTEAMNKRAVTLACQRTDVFATVGH